MHEDNEAVTDLCCFVVGEGLVSDDGGDRETD